MDKPTLQAIAERWEGTARGYTELTFDQAYADMQALLTAVREQDRLQARIAELEAHVRKRNADLQAFVTEVARLAHQKYADYLERRHG